MSAMKRTYTHLADGRQLIYYDRRDDADRTAVDLRELPDPPPSSELRHDPLLDEMVAIAAHRQARTFQPGTGDCPLCPSKPGKLTEIPAADYEVAVFENRFPSFSHRGGGSGRAEVVCFSPDHDASFHSLSQAHIRTIMEAWADRTEELAALPGVRQVFCFENRGAEIGATLPHPHGQIYAYPMLPPRTRRVLETLKGYRGDLFADVLAAEREEAARIVGGNEHWTAFVPKAARWPFEVHFFPHRGVADLASLYGAERDSFGPLYTEVLKRLDGLFGLKMPYVSAWHQAPVGERDGWRLHLQLFSSRRAPDKLKHLAGSESAMGVFINDIRPEEAAKMLRDATPVT